MQFNLPEEIPQLPPNVGTVSVAQTIAQLYMSMLYPFEQWYKNNMQDQQKKAMASRQSGQQPSGDSLGHNRIPSGSQPGQMPRGPMGSLNMAPGAALPSTINGSSAFPQPSTPHIPTQRPESTAPNQLTPGTSHSLPGGFPHDTTVNGLSSDANILDQELQGIKRKVEYEEQDGKRVRQKTGEYLIEVISLVRPSVVITDSEPPENTIVGLL